MTATDTMSITLSWRDGPTKDLTGVESFRKSWAGDEWVVYLDFADGGSDQYTGKWLAVTAGEVA